MTAKFLCSYVFFNREETRSWGLFTANDREVFCSYVLFFNRELRECGRELKEPRNFFVLMFLCLFFNREEARSWEGSLPRRSAKFFVLMSLCLFFNREETRSWEGTLPRMTAKFFCSYVFMSFLTANNANVAEIR